MKTMKKMASVCFVLIAGILLAGCQTTNTSSSGNGPIMLSVGVYESFQDYLTKPDPLAFAVSPNGRVLGRYYCTRKGKCGLNDARSKALTTCNSKLSTGLNNCKIFALKHKIIWKGPVTRQTYPGIVEKYYGYGPMNITQAVNRDYINYLNLRVPLAFAVSADGKNSGWYYCKEFNRCLDVDAKAVAINYCNGKNPSRKCKILAIKKKLVWRGRVTSN